VKIAPRFMHVLDNAMWLGCAAVGLAVVFGFFA
jgi:hypothetical protein